MNLEEDLVKNKIWEAALDLYFKINGEKAYNVLLTLITRDWAQAEQILINFIRSNINTIIYHTKSSLLTKNV